MAAGRPSRSSRTRLRLFGRQRDREQADVVPAVVRDDRARAARPPCRCARRAWRPPSPVVPIAGSPRCPNTSAQAADRVDEVGRHERERHRPDDAERLQVAAERGVEQQRQQAPRDDAQVGRGQRAARRGTAPTGAGARSRRTRAAVRTGAAISASRTPWSSQRWHSSRRPGAERVRHQRVEAEQQPHPEDRRARGRGCCRCRPRRWPPARAGRR